MVTFLLPAGVWSQSLQKPATTPVPKSQKQIKALPASGLDHEIAKGNYAAASLLLQLGHIERALAALDLTPVEEEGAVLLRVEALDQAGRGPDALRYLSGYLQTHPSLSLRVLEAQLLVATGEPRQALNLLSSISSSPRLTDQDLFTLGTTFLQAKRFPEADAAFERLQQIRPGAITCRLIGRVYRDADRPVEARRWLRAALRQDPRLQLAHYYLGTLDIAHEGSVDLPSAEREFKEELAANPQDLLTRLYLGIVLVQARKTAEAIPVLSAIPEQQSGFAAAQAYLAQAYLDEGSYPASASAATAALHASENASAGSLGALSLAQQAKLHYVLGQAHRKLGDNEAAALDFKQSQELKAQDTSQVRDEMTAFLSDAATHRAKSSGPALLRWMAQVDDAPATQSSLTSLQTQMEALLTQKATLLSGDGDAEEAHRLLQGELRIFPESVPLTLADATILLTNHQEQEALTVLIPLQKANPDNVQISDVLGHAYFQLNRFSDAADMLQRSGSEELSTEYELAVSLAQAGQDLRAERAFAQLLHDHPNSAELQVLLGKASVSAGKSDEALAYLRRALQLDATVPEAHFEIGLLSLKNGDLVTADEEFRTEVHLHPGAVPAKLYEGFALGLQQKHDEAIAVVRVLVQDHPAYAEAYEVLGKELLAANRPQEAVPVLIKASQLDPSKPANDYQLGQAYRKLGRTADAETAFASMKRKQAEQKQKEALPAIQ
jgi:tetratricopeptide (TPR) repeat protein